MQNYLLLTPVSASTQLTTLINATGEVEVFSLGSDGQVYWFSPDTESDSGWAQATLPFTGTVQSIAAGLTSDGQRIVFAGIDQLCYLMEDDNSPTGWGTPQTTTFASPSRMSANSLGGQLYLTTFYALGGPYDVYWMQWTGGDSKQVFAAKVNDPEAAFLPTSSGDFRLAVAITPRLYFATTDEFEPDNLYWDKGSGAKLDGSFWRPIPPANFLCLGDYAQGGNYNPPVGSMLCVQSVDDPLGAPLLQVADEYTQVWNDKKSGAKEDGAVWFPVPPNPAEYTAIGGMAERNYDPPPAGLVYCVRNDLLGSAQIGDLIWSDQDSGATEDIAVYKILPTGTDQAGTGCFYTQTNYDPPDGVVSCPLTTSQPSFVYLVGDPFELLTGDLTVTGFAATLDAQGAPNYFVIAEGSQNPYWYDPSTATWQLVSSLQVISMAASLDSQGILELWMLGSDARLYHVRQDGSAWSDPVPLLDQVGLFQVTRDGDGFSQAFAVTAANQLFHVAQGPVTTNWKIEEVEVQGAQIQEVQGYTTIVTLTDGEGVPLAGTATQVWASEPILLTVNGGTYQVDPVRPANVTANEAGQLALTSLTGSLGTATLSLWAAPMAEGETVTIEPNASLQAQLADLTADQVLEAQDQSGEYLLSGEYRTEGVAEAIATAIQQCMELTGSGSTGSAAGAPGRGLPHHQGRHHGGRRVSLHSLPRRSWVFGGPAGTAPTFRWLEGAEREAYFAERASLPKAEDASDFLGDLGDLLYDFGEGVLTIAEIAIDYISEGVSAVITLLIDGATYVYNGTVSLVQQVFDLVQLVWAQVLVVWEQIWEWLAFFFDWSDIQLTREAIAYSIQVLFGFLTAASAGVRSQIDNGIGQLQSQLQNLSQQIIQQLGSQTIGGLQTSNEPSTDLLSETLPFNIFLTGLFTTAGVWSLPAAAQGTLPSPSDPISQAFAGLSSYLGTLVSSDAVAQAIDYFQQASASPDVFLQEKLADLVSLGEAVISAALDGAQEVVDALFGVLSELLSAFTSTMAGDLGLGGSFVGLLYEFLFGSEMTALDLLTLVLAIPATLIYKLGFDAAPFTEASLVQLEQVLTVPNLLAASGLGGSATAIAELDPDALSSFRTFYDVLYGVTYAVYAVTEPVLDGTPLKAPPPSPLWSWFVMGLEWGEMASSVPWVQGATGGPGCSADGVTIWNWITDVVACIGDLIFLKASGKPTLATNAGDLGVCFDYFVGSLDLWLGLLSAVLDQDPADGVEEAFAALTDIFKGGRFSTVVEATRGASLVVTMGVDVVGDAVVAVMSIAIAIGGSDATRALAAGGPLELDAGE